jgi:glycosyltransferase involved in cell wall biosynthesis
VAGSPRRYQRFLRDSLAEFGIAKSGYVNSRCGWFSDRTACYLATGRPVLTHDTGFTSEIPSGSGLFRFRDKDDVITAVESLRKDPARHAREARHLAERFFDSDRVLADLIERVA